MSSVVCFCKKRDFCAIREALAGLFGIKTVFLQQITPEKQTAMATLEDFIRNAFAEDIGEGDHTSLSSIPASARGKSVLLIKEAGIVAGVRVALEVFRLFDPQLQTRVFIQDGQKVKPGDIVFETTGSVRSLLQTERLMLNIMQRMSGIATTTRLYADQLQGLHTMVIDTRKTTPGMRLLEKEAVVLGGGSNHRMGLYDMILLKDNHVDFAGGIARAIAATRQYLQDKKLNLKIEIEVRSLDELEQVLQCGGVDRIMLDNFDPGTTRKAVERIAGSYETESSGGITLDTIRAYAECGVDFISVGALTHSVQSLDMSFKAVL